MADVFSIIRRVKGAAATVRKWKEFKRTTGVWPLLSTSAAVFEWIAIITGGMFLIWYSDEKHWSKSYFALVLLGVMIPFIFGWGCLRDRIWLRELRRVRRRRQIGR